MFGASSLMARLIGLFLVIACAGCEQVRPLPPTPVEAGIATPRPRATPIETGTATPRQQATLPSDLPAGFPLPPDYSLLTATASPLKFTLSLRVVSPEQALQHFRSNLPAAGYRVREGSLRPRGGLVTGQSLETRLVGGLIFTSGIGDDESEPGGVDVLADTAGGQVEIDLPRVGRPASAATASPITLPLASGSQTPPSSRATSRAASPALRLPPELPLPPGIASFQIALARSPGSGLTGRVRVGDGPATYRFYQTALSPAGYQSREIWQPDLTESVFVGRLAFTGHGQAGHVTIHSDASGGWLTIRVNELPGAAP